MSSRVRKSNDKNQQILKVLLKEQGNSHCADCKTASHPRWASWNLGIFICIRCSGIHRSMGTHISRVKSVDLDTWTDEQIQSMVKWGNSKANQFWEAKFQNNHHVPDDSKIENFIRTKYDLKKWAASSKVPDPSTLSGSGSTNAAAPAVESKQLNNITTSTSNTNRRSLNSNLLDLEFGSPIAAPKSASPTASSFQQVPKPSSNLESLNSSLAPPPNQQHQKQQQFQQPPQQQQQQQQRPLNTRPDLKKSILSLYSTPVGSNSTPNFSTNNHLQSQSTSSLNGLNFNNTGTSTWSNHTTNSTNQWSNMSSTNNTTTNFSNANTSTTSNPLDDDLFKNVWK